MNNSSVSRKNCISETDPGRVVLETVEAAFKPKGTWQSAAGKVNPQPLIQPVAERFPALEEQEICLMFLAPESG